MKTLKELCNLAEMNNIQKVFIVDAETDGLYGDIFSIGAVVADIETFEIQDKFQLTSMQACDNVKDDVVLQNIVPVIKNDKNMVWIPFNREVLIDCFWKFYQMHDADSLIIADFGTPVEAFLFRRAIEHDPEKHFKGPYPLHELGTILLLNGYNPDMDRSPFYGKFEYKHQPLHDCISSLKILAEIYRKK